MISSLKERIFNVCTKKNISFHLLRFVLYKLKCSFVLDCTSHTITYRIVASVDHRSKPSNSNLHPWWVQVTYISWCNDWFTQTTFLLDSAFVVRSSVHAYWTCIEYCDADRGSEGNSRIIYRWTSDAAENIGCFGPLHGRWNRYYFTLKLYPCYEPHA